MYNKKMKAWISEPYQDAILQWSKEDFNKDNPRALFIQADVLLSKASKGDRTADAVYLMERAAKLGDAQAAFAMGQMAQYGWAVGRSRKLALSWYEKAAELGYQEAKDLLEQLRRQKKRRVILAGTISGIAVCLAAAAILIVPKLLPVSGILVGEDTVLIQPATQEEFVDALNDLITQYDTELVIAGQQSTNRLLLKFEGTGIDLTRFPAAEVIADTENYVVIQFTDEDEAQKCLETLRTKRGILFADMDGYSTTPDADPPSDAFSVSSIPYASPYTGINYYSWGAEFLGLDQLAAWLKTQQTTPVTVAVLDTGSEPCEENKDKILQGASMAYPSIGDGQHDKDGHGTHVAGTIIDCTWGLDVSILPVQVLNNEGHGSDSRIAQGLRYAIENHVDVINMSLGGASDNIVAEHEDCGSPIDYYIHEAVKQGIVVVVSAGNGDDDGNPLNTNEECPAHLDDCIVVAACGPDGSIGSFSNYGSSVDVCAPGIDILSYFPDDQLEMLTGTSMAAPHISALAAMLKLYLPDASPAQIEKYIKDYSILPGSSDYYGNGIPWAGYFAGD